MKNYLFIILTNPFLSSSFFFLSLINHLLSQVQQKAEFSSRINNFSCNLPNRSHYSWQFEQVDRARAGSYRVKGKIGSGQT